MPVAHLSLTNLKAIKSKLYESLRNYNMLPDEYGFIVEKMYPLSKANSSEECLLAPEGFACKTRWNSEIRQRRAKIGMSVFFSGNSQEIPVQYLNLGKVMVVFIQPNCAIF